MPNESPDAESLNIPISIAIEHIFPEDLPTYFVETVIAQYLPDHFVLSFFEVFPPVVVAASIEEQAALINSMKSLRAKCVSRVVVTPAKMREIVQIFTASLGGFDQATKQQQEK